MNYENKNKPTKTKLGFTNTRRLLREKHKASLLLTAMRSPHFGGRSSGDEMKKDYIDQNGPSPSKSKHKKVQRSRK